MASASIVFTKLAKEPADFISHEFASQTVATGAASTACPAEFNYAMITALGGNIWIALTTDDSTPDPSVATARIPVQQDSVLLMMVQKGVKIGVLDQV